MLFLGIDITHQNRIEQHSGNMCGDNLVKPAWMSYEEVSFKTKWKMVYRTSQIFKLTDITEFILKNT